MTQIIFPVTDAPTMIAGIPAIVRAARSIRDAGSGPVYFCVHQPEPHRLNWRDLASRAHGAVIDYNGSLAPIRESIAKDRPLLVMSSDGVPEINPLIQFIEQSKGHAPPTAWLWNGRRVATYYPDPKHFLSSFENEGLIDSTKSENQVLVHAPRDAWHDLGTPEEIKAAERRLFQSLGGESDGYLARLDRRISIALSRRLIRTRVSPNQITTFSLILGLIGAALIAQTHYWIQVLGAALLWACCIFDGCDGEVARLKLLHSPKGARYDVACDNVSHIAIFSAVAAHIYRTGPGTHWAAASLAMISGVLMSMFTVWRLILRKPPDHRPEFQRIFERIASRDYVYLIFFLVLIRKLNWFLGAVAVGAHLFWISLWIMSLKDLRHNNTGNLP